MAIFDNSGSQASQHNSSEPPRKAPFKKGDFIGQEYEVFDVLGEGGFGIVYLVYKHETKSVYALKTFRDEYLEDIKTRERFRKEAQVWIDLERHPYLVRAPFVDEISGRLYIAMEHIASDEPGMNTLDGFLRCKPPDLAQSLRWAIQFCYGMEYAYSKGVKAHRDIKPANIMIDQNKTVKITDFGLARVLIESSISEQGNVAGKSGNDSSMQTAIGTSIGTPEYMPPEQFTDLTVCDERSDIYSFGIVLYQMASGGKLPFYTDNPTFRWTALKHFHQEAPAPRLKSPFSPIIFRCLEKNPINRYFSFKELRRDLESLLKKQTGEIVKLPELKELETWELGNKGVSLANLGKDQEAIACYDRALEIDPGDATAWNNKGNSLATLGKDQEAIACFDKALEINPGYADAWFNKGNLLHELKQYDKALHDFDMALSFEPNHKETLNNKAICLSDMARYSDALTCYDQILSFYRHDPATWNNKGTCLIELKHHHEAIVCFDNAIKLDPAYAAPWLNKGTCLHKLGCFNEAIICFNKAFEINPCERKAWIGKGRIAIDLGNDNEALLCYEKAIDLDPGDAATWNNKGNILEGMGKHVEALSCFDTALKIDPQLSHAWYNKGINFYFLGNFIEALSCFNKSLDFNPSDDGVWYNKGVVLDTMGRSAEAITSYDEAIKYNSRKAAPWNNKGIILDKLGRHQEAIACYAKGLELEPTNPGTWYNKAIAEDKLGLQQYAIQSFKQLIELAPAQHKAQVEYARRRIEELEGK